MDVNFDDLGLTVRQSAFVKELFANNFNGTKAVILAGYSEKGAAVRACKLLKLDNVQAAIERIRQSVAEKMAAPKVINDNLNQAGTTAEAIAITAENLMFNLGRMGLTEHLRAKFLTETEGHLRYDFSTATPEELEAISAQIEGVTYKSTTRKEPRKDQEPVEITTIESKIMWVDRKSTIELMGRYKEIMAWKDTVEVKDPGAMTPEQRQEEIKRILQQALLRGGKQLVEGTIN